MNEENSNDVAETVADNSTKPSVETKGKVKAKEEKKTTSNNQTTSITRFGDNASLNNLNLFDEQQLAAAKNFLTEVMRSDKGGIKTVNEGLAVLMRAKDLNLPFSTCIEHIHVINGKTGVDIHIVKALLSRAGCTWECLKDYQPLYEYTDGINVYIDGSFPDYVERCKDAKEAKEKAEKDDTFDTVYIYPVKWYKDFNGNLYKDYQLNTTQFQIVLNQAQAVEVAKAKKVAIYRVANQPVDYITEYIITRNQNGKEITAKGRFTYLEAVQADMFSKDTYKKYPRILIGHRAFTYAAREVASDILFGVMETTELKIVAGAELNGADTSSFEDAEVVEIG